MEPLLSHILNNDPPAVGQRLREFPGLASALIQEPRLYRERIFHWIYRGDTPLHLAAAGYRTNIIQLLIENGADPNAASNSRRSSPFHYAADGFISGPTWDPEEQVQTLRYLHQNGAKLNLQDKNGATALHRATRTRCAAAVRFLLESGADPTARNQSGSSPFHLAVQDTGRGGSGEPIARDAQVEIIRTFLSFGVSPNLRDGNGRSVKECARNPRIHSLLN